MTEGDWSFADPITGVFSGKGFSGPAVRLATNTPPGFVAVIGRHDPLSKRLDPDTGQVVDWQPDAPADTDHYTQAWNAETRRYVATPTLARLRLDAWERVKARRDERLAAQATANGIAYRITKDRANLEPILTTRMAAAVPASTTQTWVDDANAPHALDHAGLTALAVAMLTRGEAIYQHSWTLRAAIAAAADVAALSAIDLEAGWP